MFVFGLFFVTFGYALVYHGLQSIMSYDASKNHFTSLHSHYAGGVTPFSVALGIQQAGIVQDPPVMLVDPPGSDIKSTPSSNTTPNTAGGAMTV